MNPSPAKHLITHVDFISEIDGFLKLGDVSLAKVLLLNLPQINAQYGEGMGTSVISSVQERLLGIHIASAVTKVSPTLYGIVCRENTDPEALRAEIQGAIQAINQENKFPFILEAAAGIVHADQEAGLDAKSWINRANLAMIDARRKDVPGVIYESKSEVFEHVRRVFGRLSTTSERPEGMYWVYQPIFDVKTAEVSGYEALGRWDAPGIGVIEPNVFVPLAEEMGVIEHIDRWTLQAVEADHHELFTHGGHFVSVNVSPRTLLADDNYMRLVNDAVKANEMCDCSLVIELTEGSIGHYAVALKPRLTELRSVGVKVAIDDFGTGQTSLTTISDVPCDFLKVDNALVHQRDLKLRAGFLEIAQRLASLLGAEVIAEGIETEEHLTSVIDANMRYGQGWLFARASRVADMPDYRKH